MTYDTQKIRLKALKSIARTSKKAVGFKKSKKWNILTYDALKIILYWTVLTYDTSRIWKHQKLILTYDTPKQNEGHSAIDLWHTIKKLSSYWLLTYDTLKNMRVNS